MILLYNFAEFKTRNLYAYFIILARKITCPQTVTTVKTVIFFYKKKNKNIKELFSLKINKNSSYTLYYEDFYGQIIFPVESTTFKISFLLLPAMYPTVL